MWKSKRLSVLLFALFTLSLSTLQGQDTIKVMYYNLLNFPDAGAANRQDTMERIFSYVQPDVLLVCELTSVSGANDLLNTLNGLGIGAYQRANYVANQSSSNNLQNLCFYRSDKLKLQGQSVITTTLRDINEYRLFQVDDLSSDTVFVDFYVTHLRAATGPANVADRAAAVGALKTYLSTQPLDKYRVFGGDLNFYTSTESGYQALLNDPPVLFQDPINRPGSWSNSLSFADIHTQSTRSTSFGGGASGGLDDRFDFIMLSQNIMSGTGEVRYRSGSYRAVGNDGLHLNQSVNQGSNLSAPAEVISALYQASDHLPVVLDLILSTTPGEPVEPTDCGDLYFSEYIEGSSNNKAIELYNGTGEIIDLSSYSVRLYNNGATTPNSTLNLSGTLADGQTYNIVNSSAATELLNLANTTSGVTFFNGNDALGLFKSEELIDVIGEIGVDPGTDWTVGSGATSEYTLVRKPEIASGQLNWAIGATEWLVYPQNTFSFFGSHSADPCDSGPELCSTTSVPTGLSSSIGPGGVTLSWDPLDGAVKCEVNGRRVGTSSFAKLRGDVPPFSRLIPGSQLIPGQSYEWKIRCACNLSPLLTTPFSASEFFTWPSLREEPVQLSDEISIYPNPASNRVQIQWPGSSTEARWFVQDIHGKVLQSGVVSGSIEHLDISQWPSGIYLVRLENQSLRSIDKLVIIH